MINLTPQPDPTLSHITQVSINLAQNAATYDVVTAAGGDVWVVVQQAYVSTSGIGFTTVAIQTNDSTPRSIVAAVAPASVTIATPLTLVLTSFLLQSTKKIQVTLVGNGSAGVVKLILQYSSSTGGTLV